MVWIFACCCAQVLELLKENFQNDWTQNSVRMGRDFNKDVLPFCEDKKEDKRELVRFV
jgi:hypothetical protein